MRWVYLIFIGVCGGLVAVHGDHGNIAGVLAFIFLTCCGFLGLFIENLYNVSKKKKKKE